MANGTRLYRHAKTGLVGRYSPRVALAHPHLIEVPEGTKPLAYTPIPHEAVKQLRAASTATVSDEDALLDDEEES